MPLQKFEEKVQLEYNLIPSRSKLGRARRASVKHIRGEDDDQYKMLWDYGEELRQKNPGNKFYLCIKEIFDEKTKETKEHFSTLYWSLDACKRGWLMGCRPIIFVDGCHIKTRYKGNLLTVVGIDPNDCISPLAFGIVEVESTSSWEWFLAS
uniref:MULE transposase domain-containing protein n=1 Tax=Aegilops tauschii subsp. strangulata TaxID=200361 RepID=A0A453AN42_AEGTS